MYPRIKIYVAGHRGMVGSAIVRALLGQGVRQQDILTRTHAGVLVATLLSPSVAHAVSAAVSYQGNITFDTSKPDGAPMPRFFTG